MCYHLGRGKGTTAYPVGTRGRRILTNMAVALATFSAFYISSPLSGSAGIVDERRRRDCDALESAIEALPWNND